MSGHNKWAQIKHKKAKTDAEKSKAFGKFARLIAMESRRAKGNADDPGLKTVIERARTVNMPNDSIARAIKKGAGGEGEQLETIHYETYGPGGVAVIIEMITDNRNKAAQEVKHILHELGFSLAAPGSALWAFEKQATGLRPTTTIPLSDDDLKKLDELVTKLESCDEVQEVFTNAE